MGTTLTGQTQSSTYAALLKITDNGPVGGTLKTVTDGLGNDSALQASTAGIASTGTLAVTGASTLAAATVTTLTATGIIKTSSTATDAINIDAAAANVRSFALKTANVLRWYFGANATAEGGANAGSDFFLASATDAGGALAIPFIVTRSTGKVSMTLGVENTPLGAVTPASVGATTVAATSTITTTASTAFGAVFVNAAAGTERTYAIKTAGNARWYWGASNAAEGGSNAGSDFFLASANDAGAFLANVLSVVRSTGVVTIGTLTVTNGLTVTNVSDSKGDVRLIPQNSQSGPYTLVLADSGKHILHPSADTTARIFTIPANASVAFTIGTVVTFVNQNAAGIITIAITTDTMRLASTGATGNRTLAANGICTALKVTATEWIVSGSGLT